MSRWPVVILAIFPLAVRIWAHTVPTISVEAEFNAAREVVLRVNLDPRLLLSTQPASLPPVPAAWWLDQDETARARSTAEVLAYLEKTVHFQIGEIPLAGSWKVTAIDSASAFPLGPNSAETHLLAENRGPLPDVPGDFSVKLDDRAPVGLILLNSREGRSERHPQAIFPGESSRGFKVPELAEPAAAPVSGASLWPAGGGSCDGIAQSRPAGTRHFAGDHFTVALVLAALLGRRFLSGAILLVCFQAVHISAALAVASGWLPDAPVWMQWAGWFALASGAFLIHRQRVLRAGICFSVAGLCHGLSLPHLHLVTADGAAILRDASLIGASQIGLLALVWIVLALVRRNQRRGDKAGMQPC